jgi:hypothetical protein
MMSTSTRPMAGLIVVTVALMLIANCSGAQKITVAGAVLEPGRFDHQRHQLLSARSNLPSTSPDTNSSCLACHLGKDDNEALAMAHNACDAGGCHRRQFVEPPGTDQRFCKTCHIQVSIAPLAAPMLPTPRIAAVRAMPSLFSHAQHMNQPAMDQAVGFHVSCADCHGSGAPIRGEGANARSGPQDGASRLVSGAEPAEPAQHSVCARCHAPEVKLGKITSMQQCVGCHQPNQVSWRHSKSLITKDLRFGHDDHLRDRSGAAIECRACHLTTIDANVNGGLAPPALSACVGCHDDSDRVGEIHRMSQCETCHATLQASLLAIAPRNHLPDAEQPPDHTIAFRTDHVEAAADAPRCARCHREVSPSTGASSSCQQCHQFMKPRDHRVTWRELDHGAESSAAPSRCAVCHTANYCTSCHQQTPRSHAGGNYRDNHAATARVNVRACITCHQVSRDCTGSGCHESGM